MGTATSTSFTVGGTITLRATINVTPPGGSTTSTYRDYIFNVPPLPHNFSISRASPAVLYVPGVLGSSVDLPAMGIVMSFNTLVLLGNDGTTMRYIQDSATPAEIVIPSPTGTNPDGTQYEYISYDRVAFDLTVNTRRFVDSTGQPVPVRITYGPTSSADITVVDVPLAYLKGKITFREFQTTKDSNGRTYPVSEITQKEGRVSLIPQSNGSYLLSNPSFNQRTIIYSGVFYFDTPAGNGVELYLRLRRRYSEVVPGVVKATIESVAIESAKIVSYTGRVSEFVGVPRPGTYLEGGPELLSNVVSGLDFSQWSKPYSQ